MITVELIIAILLLVILIPLWFCAIINKYLPKWFCDKMGWHLEPDLQGFDGCSFNGTCPRCGKKVLQDSQGNWF
jgi:hypothetical protein